MRKVLLASLFGLVFAAGTINDNYYAVPTNKLPTNNYKIATVAIKGTSGTISANGGISTLGTVTGNKLVAGSGGLVSTVLALSGSTPQLSLGNSSTATFKDYFWKDTSDWTGWDTNRNPGSGVFDDTNKTHTRIEMQASNSASKIGFYTGAANNTAATERMTISSNGNVGIGTTAPSTTLHVKGSTAIDAMATIIDSKYRLSIFNHDVGQGGMVLQSNSLTETGPTNASNRTLILNPVAGNVGIGVTNPSTKLEVAGTNEYNGGTSSIQNGQINVKGSGGKGGGIAFGRSDGLYTASIGVTANEALYLANAGSGGHIALMTNGGNVGIGITDPSNKLDISGSAPAATLATYVTNTAPDGYSILGLKNSGAGGRDYQLALGGATSYGELKGSFYIYDVSANANRLLINSAGNVGIGTIAPSTKLDVAGTVSMNGLVVNGISSFKPTLAYQSNIIFSESFTLAQNATKDITVASDAGNSSMMTGRINIDIQGSAGVDVGQISFYRYGGGYSPTANLEITIAKPAGAIPITISCPSQGVIRLVNKHSTTAYFNFGFIGSGR